MRVWRSRSPAFRWGQSNSDEFTVKNLVELILESKWLLPHIIMILTKPPSDFVDDLADAYAVESGSGISKLS